MCICGNRIDFRATTGGGACRACKQQYTKAGQIVTLRREQTPAGVSR
jgi:hypothetical protein